MIYISLLALLGFVALNVCTGKKTNKHEGMDQDGQHDANWKGGESRWMATTGGHVVLHVSSTTPSAGRKIMVIMMSGKKNWMPGDNL